MKFLPRKAFAGDTTYQLLPLRFRRLPWDNERVFISSMAGEWTITSRDELTRIVEGRIEPNEPLFAELQAKHFITADQERSTLAPLLSQYKTRKAYLEQGPTLHIFVITLRCHHTCAYCQVSRQPQANSGYDMPAKASLKAVERLFEWPSKTLTVEFQGGEPLLHFARIRTLVEAIEKRNQHENRDIQFVIASTLHDLTDEQLAFMKAHRFQLSTSLDGPEWLHNANRPRPERDSYQRTLQGIERGRKALGDDAVSALTTLTKRSLETPEAIVDEYKKQGFHSIFLRPLSPYGFAVKTANRNGYPIGDFLHFYAIALDHILAMNRSGYVMEEVYSGLLLSQLLTPFSHGYVDLRSPTGAGLGAVVYDYDGKVYPSDEARMLAAMGDHSFVMGDVDDPVSSWLNSPVMKQILEAGVAEALPTCSDCAYVSMCGADPIDHYARQHDAIGHRPSSDFCRKQLGMFDHLLERWEKSTVTDRRTLESWALRVASRAPQVEAA